MNAVNNVGNLGKDPVVKYGADGVCRAYLSIGVHEYSAKEKKRYTEWVDVRVKGKMAEAVGNHLNKGSLVSVEGCLRSYMSEKDGVRFRVAYVQVSGYKGYVKFLNLKKAATAQNVEAEG